MSSLSGRHSNKNQTDELRLYGRRRGKKLRLRRQQLIDRLLPGLSVEPEALAAGSLDPQSLFDISIQAIWLEIGFGGGEHLLQQAIAHPDIGFIGCEPFIDGVAKVVAEIDRLQLRNIRLYADDARKLLPVLAPDCLNRVVLLFPDPWPKKRHNKRRFVNRQNVEAVARVLRPGGEWCMATDVMDYARCMLLQLTSAPDFHWTAEGPRDWRRRSLDWPATRYEEKALAGGRCPVYLRFRKDDAPGILPGV